MTLKPIYLTAEGIAQLEQELQHLETVRRREIAERLKRAIQEGDLSENFGYVEAKREQAMLEGQIAEIRAKLKAARPLTSSDSGRVALGSTVTVQQEGYPPETYQIVHVAEADLSRGRISDASPFGKALLGHGQDEVVEAVTPRATICLRILRVE